MIWVVFSSNGQLGRVNDIHDIYNIYNVIYDIWYSCWIENVYKRRGIN